MTDKIVHRTRFPFENSTQKSNLSRHGFLSLLAFGGSAAMLASCGSKEISSTSEGYSIFHETMVEMTWPEIEQAAQDKSIILLPVGIIEEHGPHMGLAVDTLVAYNWCKMTRRALETKGIKSLIAPACYWGISEIVDEYPGTFSVRASTFAALLYDIHASLNQWGFKYVFSFNAHGDSLHNRVYQDTIKEIHEKLDMQAYLVCTQDKTVSNREYAVFLKEIQLPASMQAHVDIHAGAYETAEMLTFFPQTVNTKTAKTLAPSSSFEPLGYWGDPASFDQIKTEEVRTWADQVATATAEAIEDFLKMKS